MKREIFFGRTCGQNISVTTEDDKIVELDFESDEHENLIGNIYKGKVMNVLSGMQAAFVNCGLEKNCYLSMDETFTDPARYDGGHVAQNEEIKPFTLKEGEEIMVQITKPPRGGKGAKVTTKVSYVGKNLIYIPRDTFMGVSRKIADDELRANLLFTMGKMREKDEGMIIRTAAPTADRRALRKELEFFRRIDRENLEKMATAKVGELIWKEEDLFNRNLRDLFTDKVQKIYVADDEHYRIVRELLSFYGDGSERKLVYYKGERDLMSQYGLIHQIIAALKPCVPLKSGGNLVIEGTEAMNVIDVNTGKFIGKDNKNLEETVFHTNLEAAREIARQVRLRNLGGLVVVDFIDMVEEEHKRQVSRALEEELSHDRTKCRVLPMSDFCVVEFTRKRINHDVAGLEKRICPHCSGSGSILSDSLIAIAIRAAISDAFANGYLAVVVELNRGVMESILKNGWYTPVVKGKWKDKRVYMVPHRTFHEEQFTVRGDNSGVLHLPDDAQILY